VAEDEAVPAGSAVHAAEPEGTLPRPGTLDGATWGGAALDPETGLLYVRTSEGADTNQMCRNVGDNPEVDAAYSNNCH